MARLLIHNDLKENRYLTLNNWCRGKSERTLLQGLCLNCSKYSSLHLQRCLFQPGFFSTSGGIYLRLVSDRDLHWISRRLTMPLQVAQGSLSSRPLTRLTRTTKKTEDKAR